jgi:NADH-quinone oxidoreductase subunit G
MPDVTVTIDGVTVTVPAGTNIVDAARKAESAIPVFCYHPKMKPVGMCRMCLVEVYTPKVDPATRQVVLGEDGKPVLALMMNKLQTACTTPVSDGMVVKTDTEKVKFAQRGVLEFLLTSHPLDCPVCDKGGECPLQNLTMQWGPGSSRFDYSDKVHFQKPIPLGDLIYLDRERCILCARCVRFQDEIADDPVLGFDNRGRAWEIISKSDPAFNSKFSGNTTDICPVGALTSADFRFKSRVWELRSVPSVCTHCPVGCNITLDMRYDNLMRVMPRENDLVNEIWVCDKGRFGMRFVGDEQRLTTPLIRRGERLEPATWDEALRLVAEKFGAIQASAGADALGGLAGPKLANEDLYLFQRLFREVLGSPNLDHRSGTAAEPAYLDDLPRALGVGSGTDLSKLGKGTAVLVIGADPEEEAPLHLLRLRGIASRGGDLTVVNSYPTKLERSATRSLRTRPGGEASLALALLRALAEENLLKDDLLPRLRGHNDLIVSLRRSSVAQLAEAAGLAEEAVRAAARAFAGAENGIIIYGRQALHTGPALVQAIMALALLTGKVGRPNSGLIALLKGGNSRGALDMGVRPDAAPGGAALPKAGLSAREMWAAARGGRLRGMYLAGINPAGDPSVAAALNALEFVVVQDLFLTETALLADVVLPAAAFAEREGTLTNAERRVQRFRQGRAAPNNLPADWEIFQNVARALSAAGVRASAGSAKKSARVRAAEAAAATAVLAPPSEWDYAVSSDVADEISRTVPGYAKTNYTSLELTRKSWGRQPNEAFYYDGTSYENTEGLGLQLAAAVEDPRSTFSISVPDLAEPAAEDARFPLTLLTPARLYNGGEWARGSKLQPRLVPAHVVLSVADAERLGVGLAETVRISSAKGALDLPAQIDKSLGAGVVLIPESETANIAALADGPYTRVSVSKVE